MSVGSQTSYCHGVLKVRVTLVTTVRVRIRVRIRVNVRIRIGVTAMSLIIHFQCIFYMSVDGNDTPKQTLTMSTSRYRVSASGLDVKMQMRHHSLPKSVYRATVTLQLQLLLGV